MTRYLINIIEEAEQLAEQHGYVLNVERNNVVLAKSGEHGVLLVLKTGLVIYVWKKATRSAPPVDFYIPVGATAWK